MRWAEMVASIYELPAWCYEMGKESLNNKPAYIWQSTAGTWLNITRYKGGAIIYQLFHIIKVSGVASTHGLERYQWF